MCRNIIIVCTLFFFSKLSAQNYEEVAPLSIGLKLGLNRSFLQYTKPNLTTNSDFKLGLHAGGFVEVPISVSFGFQGEIVYNQTGGINTVGNEQHRVRINYLSLPIFCKFYFPRSGFSAYAGCETGLILRAMEKTPSKMIRITNQFKSREIAALAGVEYAFPAGLVLSLRYVYDFSDIEKTLKDGEIQYRLFNFSTAIKF